MRPESVMLVYGEKWGKVEQPSCVSKADCAKPAKPEALGAGRGRGKEKNRPRYIAVENKLRAG